MSSLKHFYNVLLVQRRSFSLKLQRTVSDASVKSLENDKHGILVVSLNREKQKNALSKSLYDSLNEIIDNIAADSATRAVIIRSSVPNVFCAGADLKERLKMSAGEVSQFSRNLRSLMMKIHYLPIPVIAAIDGLALGGGLELALACDIRVATTTAKLGLVETRLAIIPGAGGTVRLPRTINPCIAKELIYTAKIIDGSEAKELGLINHAVEQNEDGNAAYIKSLGIAKEILPNGPVAIRMAKFAINRGLEVSAQTALAIEEACYAQVIPTEDRIEGLRAFNEKRSPKYTGQ